MQITIVVPDKMVAVNGRPVTLEDIDWTPFDGDSATPFDRVHAVHFDTDSGHGHVEYAVVITKPPGRPNMKPGDWLINASDFESSFAWILPLYNERRAWLDAEQAEKEKAQAEAIAAAEEETRLRRATAQMDAMKLNADPVLEDLAALKAEIESLRAIQAEHTENFSIIKGT